MTSMEEVPTLSLPREDMMRTAMALRTAGNLLRQIREMRGRAAYDDAENVARKEAAAAANGLRTMTPEDAEEWNQAARAGRIFAERHPDSGMTVRVAPLSGGRFGVQAGWEDNNTTTVVGSEQMANDLRGWLRNNSNHGAVNDLRDATSEIHQNLTDTYEGRRAVTVERAKAWAAKPENEVFQRLWEDPDELWRANSNRGTIYTNDDWLRDRYEDAERLGATNHAAAQVWLYESGNEELQRKWEDPNGWLTETLRREDDLRDGHLVGSWREASRAERVSGAAADTLADRVRGRVPNSVLDNNRWPVAEEQFANLVKQGADPQMLADTVAGIDFNAGVRSPSGFAAWAMRDAAKMGRAQKPGEATSEDQAKREIAEEWLGQADADSPLDRARAAQLVGQIDDKFDAQLADRYPGILDGDRLRTTANSRAEHHEGNVRAAESAAAGREAEADLDRGRVIAIDSEGNAVLPFEPFTPAEADRATVAEELGHVEDQAENASVEACNDRAYAASERDHAQHERDAATNATNQPTAAARKANGPLKPPTDAQKAARTAARKAAASHAPTATRIPKRSM